MKTLAIICPMCNQKGKITKPMRDRIGFILCHNCTAVILVHGDMTSNSKKKSK